MLRRLLESRVETVQDMDLAADEKYWDGLELLTAGRRGAGIYLMGYAAEMKLKVAYLRLQGATPAAAAHPYLGPARRRAMTLIPRVRDETYHSVRFWGLLVRADRVRKGRPLDPATDRALRWAVNRAYLNWWVPMRYLPDQSTSKHAEQLLANVSWIMANYTKLWR